MVVFWDPEKHPRIGKGKTHGGWFAPVSWSEPLLPGGKPQWIPDSPHATDPNAEPKKPNWDFTDSGTKKQLGKVGYQIGKVSDIPASASAFGPFKAPAGPLPRDALMAGTALASVTDSLKGTALEVVHQRASTIKVVFAEADPKIMMVTAIGGGKATFVINTAADWEADATQSIDPKVSVAPGTIAEQWANTEYNASGDVDRAVMILARGCAIHEIAHMADAASGGALSDSMAMVLYQAAKNTVGDDTNKQAEVIGQWLQQNISGYAASGGSIRDAMAEVVTMYMLDPGTVPEPLDKWAETMVGKIDTPISAAGD